jgi:ubiquinone/menaquinone biosynthesis C-methylase UbiE
MERLRDSKKVAQDIIAALGITNDGVILELGTGTGSFAVEAANHCAKVIAVDISPTMLDYAEKKAVANGVKNIEFHSGGFLTYEHSGDPVDAVVSQLALHHLPDFWKIIALKKVAGMLKPGGRMFLRDVVYSFNVGEYAKAFNEWLEEIEGIAGIEAAIDTETAIREEYATLGWIMEGLLSRAGFTVEESYYDSKFIAAYVCSKG